MSSEDSSKKVHRLGDKDLPFKDCDKCGDSNVDLYVIDNGALCERCADAE